MHHLWEGASEWKTSLWLVAVEFKKAFGTIDHNAIWEALHELGFPTGYTAILRRLYQGQTGQVVADANSRTFKIKRGTKQGDPISPTICSAVLEVIMRRLKLDWGAKRYGLRVGFASPSLLQNLRFADDLLLAARTLPQAKHMLEDLVQHTGSAGLQIHMGKTKILTTVDD